MDRPSPRLRSSTSIPALVALAAVLLSACGGAAGTPGASPGPSASPGPDDIVHPTGADEIVLRFEEGGGILPVDFFITHAPSFNLYGDGTLIIRDASAPPVGAGGVVPASPFLVARLAESQVQALLREAIAVLAPAREHYDPGNVADAPTATFTISAEGTTKSVSVVALGLEDPQSPDGLMLGALARLGDRLRTFSDEVTAARWTPERYRGILREQVAPAATSAWPWPDLVPGDFVSKDGQDGPLFPRRVMTAAEIEATGVTGFEGGFDGLLLQVADGTTYSFGARPLLPDEEA
jgi:hypothetical protein